MALQRFGESQPAAAPVDVHQMALVFIVVGVFLVAVGLSRDGVMSIRNSGNSSSGMRGEVQPRWPRVSKNLLPNFGTLQGDAW